MRKKWANLRDFFATQRRINEAASPQPSGHGGRPASGFEIRNRSSTNSIEEQSNSSTQVHWLDHRHRWRNTKNRC